MGQGCVDQKKGPWAEICPLFTPSGANPLAPRNLFGELQMKSLADYVQAALMLNYNQRSVG